MNIDHWPVMFKKGPATTCKLKKVIFDIKIKGWYKNGWETTEVKRIEVKKVNGTQQRVGNMKDILRDRKDKVRRPIRNPIRVLDYRENRIKHKLKIWLGFG